MMNSPAMTPNITREEREAIARVMGMTVVNPCDEDGTPYYDDCDAIRVLMDTGESRLFNPAPGGNPADTFAMYCKLKIDVVWYENSVMASKHLEGKQFMRVAALSDFNNDEQAAAAYAVCKVVAAVQLEKEKQG